MLLDRRHATFRQAADRERFLLSVPPEAVSLPTGLHGKLISPGGSSFNLSHCSYLVVLAGDGSTSVRGLLNQSGSWLCPAATGRLWLWRRRAEESFLLLQHGVGIAEQVGLLQQRIGLRLDLASVAGGLHPGEAAAG